MMPPRDPSSSFTAIVRFCAHGRLGGAAAAIALALLVSGCARYRPAPLADPAAALAPPDIAIVSADAAGIDRPYLAPQPIDLGQPLTPNALAVLAVLENPDLKA